jgi:hypothetical protein
VSRCEHTVLARSVLGRSLSSPSLPKVRCVGCSCARGRTFCKVNVGYVVKFRQGRVWLFSLADLSSSRKGDIFLVRGRGDTV